MLGICCSTILPNEIYASAKIISDEVHRYEDTLLRIIMNHVQEILILDLAVCQEK